MDIDCILLGFYCVTDELNVQVFDYFEAPLGNCGNDFKVQFKFISKESII